MLRASHGRCVQFKLPEDGPPQLTLYRGGTPEKSAAVAAVDDVAVVSIPVIDLGLTAGQGIHFYMELFEARNSLDRIPSEGMIELTVPAEDFDIRNWQV